MCVGLPLVPGHIVLRGANLKDEQQYTLISRHHP